MAEFKKVPKDPRVEITGSVLRIVYSKLNPTDGKIFYILTFQPDASCAAVLKQQAMRVPEDRKGGATQYHLRVKLDTKLGIRPGQRVTLRGFFQKDANFGWQFKALSAEADTVKAREDELLLALGSVKGNNGCPLIGRDRLKKLKQHFGGGLANILEKDPARLREAVPALTDAEAVQLGEAWRQTRANDERETLTKLQQLPEIGPERARAILDEFGKKALATILRDPYAISRSVPGIGFLTADQIALHLNLSPMVRTRGRVEHLVTSAAEENGNCGVVKAGIVKAAAEAVGSLETEVEKILEPLVTGKNAVLLEEDGVIWVKSLLAAEQRIAEWIRETLAQPFATAVAGDRVEGLTDEQSEALSAILSAPVSILTGGPGTGKTTVLREVAARDSCVLCAPTGRAAKRLSEVTGQNAMTLHRLILQKSNPIARGSLLVIDECSMADVEVMAAVAGRCAVKMPRLLFVGDADQLPSVGAGQVFRDLIACGRIPVHRLTKNFRSAGSGGGIVAAASAVLGGKIPKKAAFEPDGDFCLVEIETAEEAAACAVEFATVILPERCQLDPLTDIQVLTPMRGGPAGVDALNAALRAKLNPAGGPGRFAPGDRVINLRNQPARGIFNGDLGVVRTVDPAKQEAVVRFGETDVLCDEKLLRWLDFAYAVTAHKSQGSEYPAVVIVLAKGHFILLDRNLLYTAMTRARRRLVIVAQKGALLLAAMSTPPARLTRLRSLLAAEPCPAKREDSRPPATAVPQRTGPATGPYSFS